MKKLLLLLGIVISICSCNSPLDNREGHKPMIEVAVSADSLSKASVRHYIYNKHTYLRFGGEHCGWAHDPDCDYCLSAFEQL